MNLVLMIQTYTIQDVLISIAIRKEPFIKVYITFRVTQSDVIVVAMVQIL